MAEGNYTLDNVQAPVPQATPKKTAEPIDLLGPNTPQHQKVIEYLQDRIRYSEQQMSGFYSRWNASEKKVQAYISLPDYENQLKHINDSGAPPAIVSVTVPYSYATIWTIVTYLIHTFCGQKPIFPVSTYKAEAVESASYMETMLQFNADHSRLILHLIQWFIDAEIYGVGAVRCLWDEEYRNTTIWTPQSPGGMIAPNMQPQLMRAKQNKKFYEGNKVQNIDPFLFLPDPRVPMSEVARRGEYVFWRSFEGKHSLLRAQAQGALKWVDTIGDEPADLRKYTGSIGGSMRSLVAKGVAIAGDRVTRDARAKPFVQIEQGTVDLIPKELGLGPSSQPEKWLFSIANARQIVQAEPLDYNHDRHPVAVIEPSSFGYAFGQPGTMDFLGPIQDSLSWFINSHIHNVRLALNNMWLVDPSMVEIQDLKTPGPGKIIRLKRSAYGQDLKSALMQLPVQNVTQNHIESMQVFLRMGDVLSAVNDNLKGIQDSGGRKTATEVRTAGEAGASRLAARARYISAQGMVDLADQMSQNIQQMQTMEYYLQVVGQKGLEHPLGMATITPQMLAGDFHFPVSDGTLPVDKAALLSTWKEIWMAIVQNPLLSQQYDAGRLFEFLAELGGAKNISQFKITLAPNDQLAAAEGAGNAVPLGTSLPGRSGAGPPAVRRPPGGPPGSSSNAAALTNGGSGPGAPRPIA